MAKKSAAKKTTTRASGGDVGDTFDALLSREDTPHVIITKHRAEDGTESFRARAPRGGGVTDATGSTVGEAVEMLLADLSR